MAFISLDSPSCEVPCWILLSVVYRDVTRQAKGLYRLKHEVALMRGLAYLSRCNSGCFCHTCGVGAGAGAGVAAGRHQQPQPGRRGGRAAAAGAMSGGRQLREGGTRCGRRRARAGASGAGAEHSAGAGRTGAGAARSAGGEGAARGTGVRVELRRGARDSDVRGLLSLSKRRWSRAARERLRHAGGAGAHGRTQPGHAQEWRSKAWASTGPATGAGGIAAQDDNVQGNSALDDGA
jgi:hypothetical protein